MTVNIQSALTKLSVFVPELKPMIPSIMAAITTGQKVQVILKPALDRLEAGEVAVLEAIEATPALDAMLPEIDTAIKTGKRVADLITSYETKLNI
jgi:hypothetical protein